MIKQSMFVWTGAFALAVMLAACAPKRDFERGSPPEGPPPEEKIQSWIAKNDVDKDGVFTCEDILLMRTELFENADADEDLFLDESEYQTLKWHNKLYILLEVDHDDEDNDGLVSLAEFQARADPYFTRLDSNQDCEVSFEEMRAELQAQRTQLPAGGEGQPRGRGKRQRKANSS